MSGIQGIRVSALSFLYSSHNIMDTAQDNSR